MFVKCFSIRELFFLFFILLPLIGIWLISWLAETNRTPFDCDEGEFELVHYAVLSYFLCLGVLFVYRVMHFHRLEFSVDSYI